MEPTTKSLSDVADEVGQWADEKTGLTPEDQLTLCRLEWTLRAMAAWLEGFDASSDCEEKEA